jgi:hypothetical protein
MFRSVVGCVITEVEQLLDEEKWADFERKHNPRALARIVINDVLCQLWEIKGSAKFILEDHWEEMQRFYQETICMGAKSSLEFSTSPCRPVPHESRLLPRRRHRGRVLLGAIKPVL